MAKAKKTSLLSTPKVSKTELETKREQPSRETPCFAANSKHSALKDKYARI